MACRTTDNTVALLTFNGRYILGSYYPDLDMVGFNYTPSEVPYGETEEMPANFQPIEFVDYITDYQGTLQSLPAEIVTRNWDWVEEDQVASYVVGIEVGTVLVDSGFAFAGDESPVGKSPLNLPPDPGV